MKNTRILWLTGLLLFAISCGDDPLAVTITSGEATLDSKGGPGEWKGFSFALGEVTTITSETNTDFSIMTTTNQVGSVTGSSLIGNSETNFAPLNPPKVRLHSLEEFIDLRTIPDTIGSWEPLAFIADGDIWFVRTRDNKYAKIFIMEVLEVTDRGGESVFSIVTFKWVYQQDGSKNFY